MQDDRTINLNIPKPSPANKLDQDLLRLREALDLIDTAINNKADAQDIADQLAALIDGAPAILDTIKELADALGNNPEFAADVAADLASITANVASIQATISALAASTISYNNAASGISATTVQGAIDYLKAISGGGSGGSQASYTRQKFTATAGQTIFTTSGYTVGYLEVFLNGVLLDITDYTAANGSTVVLATGAAAGDELVTISLDSFNIANLLRVLVASASAPAGSVSVGADGGLTVRSLNGGQLAGMRNRIINGDMRIDQRNGGGAVTGEAYVLDRWRVWHQTGFTKQQSTDAPAGFKYSFKVTKTDSSQAGWGYIVQYIEGTSVADLGFGTANAASVTVSFWVKSSVAGVYTASITNSAENRSYPINYTINSANTWEYKTITFPGDTSGTWLTDTGRGLSVQFNFGGNNAVAAPGAWNNVNAVVATGSTNLGTTNGGTFYLTGVQVEKGTVATPFEFLPYGVELALCHRYYWQKSGDTGNTTQWNIGFYNSKARIAIPMVVPMRSAPSIGFSGNVSGAFFATNDDATYYNFSYVNGYSEYANGVPSAVLNLTGASGTGMSVCYIQSGRTLSFYAEL